MKPYLTTIVLSILLFSCEYNLSDLKIEDITPLQETPHIAINVNDINDGDTIVLRYADVAIDIDALTDGKRLLSFTIIRGQSTPYELNNIPDKWNLNLDHFDEGLTPITLSMIVSSGTNSLADKLNAEGYKIELKFFVFKVPRYTNDIISLSESISDGRLKLEWNKYPFPDFEAYIINGKEIKDQNTVSLIDSNFVESYTYHEISVKASGRIVSQHSFYTSYKIKPFSYSIDNDKLIVKWNKTQFYNNFNKYIIYSTDYKGSRDSNRVYETSLINDTSCIITTCPFGRIFAIDLRFVSADEHQSFENKHDATDIIIENIELGENSNLWFGSKIMHPVSKDIIRIYNDSITFYDEELNKNTRAVPSGDIYKIFRSQNGSHWGAYTYNRLYKFNPATLEYTKILDLDDIRNKLKLNIGFGKVVCDGNGDFYISLYDCGRYGCDFKSAILYKYNSSNGNLNPLSLSNADGTSSPIFEISESGEYAICNDYSENNNQSSYLYKIVDNRLLKIEGAKASDFLPLKNEVIFKGSNYQNSNTEVKIYRLSDYSTVIEYTLESENEVTFSPLNDLAIIHGNQNNLNKSYIIDVHTGNVINSFYGFAYYILSGKYVYTSEKRLRLKN